MNDENWIIAVAKRGNVTVQFENLDEGYFGDYHPDDPDDVNLLRFTVYFKGEEVDDASYCTQIPASTDASLVQKCAERILREVYDPLTSGFSIKRLGECLSWTDVD